MNRIRTIFNKVKEFLSKDIWEVDAGSLSRFKAKLLKYARIVLLTATDFKRENINWQAVALSFFTIMSFVPFIAMMFAISDYVGLGDYLRGLIYDNFGHREIVDLLLGFAGNIIETSRNGVYGIISFVLFFWMVMWLLMCIEKSMNSIWKVRKNRVLWKRAVAYLIVILASPFVMTIFLSVSMTITDGLNTLGMVIPMMQSVSTLLIWLAFFVFIAAGLTFIYKFIPNAKVRFLPAMSAAIIAAFAFTVVQYLYLETQVFVSRLNAVYGVFAAVPLFMIWLNIGWFIVLVGSELSYAFQNVDKYPLEEMN